MKQSILGMLPYNDPWATIMQLNGHLRIYKTIIPYITCKLVSDVWKIHYYLFKLDVTGLMKFSCLDRI